MQTISSSAIILYRASIKNTSNMKMIMFGLILYGLYRLTKKREDKADMNMNMMPPREAGATLSACSFCGKSCIRRCSRCKAASYCSDVCQYEHWRFGHEYECVETKNDSATLKIEMQVEEILRELVNALSDAENFKSQADIAENECAKLKKEVEEYKKLVQRLQNQPKHDESQTAKRKLEETCYEILLVNALDDAANAKSRADFAESECARMQNKHQEQQKLVERLKLESENAERKVEEKSVELENALRNVEKATSSAEIAENKCANQMIELKEQRMLVQKFKLEQDEAKRNVEEISHKLSRTLNDLSKAKNKCADQKGHLKEQRKLIQKLKLEQDEAKRNVEEISQKLASTLNDLSMAKAKVCDLEKEIKSSDDFKLCAICLTNEKGTAFPCGHMTCQDCDKKISSICPICRKQIRRRIKLFFG